MALKTPQGQKLCETTRGTATRQTLAVRQTLSRSVLFRSTSEWARGRVPKFGVRQSRGEGKHVAFSKQGGPRAQFSLSGHAKRGARWRSRCGQWLICDGHGEVALLCFSSSTLLPLCRAGALEVQASSLLVPVLCFTVRVRKLDFLLGGHWGRSGSRAGQASIIRSLERRPGSGSLGVSADAHPLKMEFFGVCHSEPRAFRTLPRTFFD